MSGPSRFYGEREEALLFECGSRVAYCYDEGFAIEHRLYKAVPGTHFRPSRQLEWLAARGQDSPADARTQAPGTPGTREALRDVQEGS